MLREYVGKPSVTLHNGRVDSRLHYIWNHTKRLIVDRGKQTRFECERQYSEAGG
jgi:hypothetical protein